MLSHVQLFLTPWTVAHRIPLSMEFSRQECWSGLQLPSPGNQTWVWATRQVQLLEKWKSELWDITSHLSQWLLPKSLQMTNFGKDVEKREPYTLWPSHVKNLLIGKDPDVGKDWRQEEKGMSEDEKVEWHHWFNGHKFEQAPGDAEGQGSLTCCNLWGLKESDTERWQICITTVCLELNTEMILRKRVILTPTRCNPVPCTILGVKAVKVSKLSVQYLHSAYTFQSTITTTPQFTRCY